MSMNMNRILMRRWTWRWLALLGLVGLTFYTTVLVEVIIEVERETRPAATYHEEAEEPEGPDAIPVFYDYPYSDVALAKKGGPPIHPPFDPILTSIFKNKEAPLSP